LAPPFLSYQLAYIGGIVIFSMIINNPSNYVDPGQLDCLNSTRSRFYDSAFRPKTFMTNFYPCLINTTSPKFADKKNNFTWDEINWIQLH
jgi:hypothetical protein